MGRSHVIGFGNPAGILLHSKKEHLIKGSLPKLVVHDSENIHLTDRKRDDPKSIEETTSQCEATSESPKAMYFFPSEAKHSTPAYCNAAYNVSTSPIYQDSRHTAAAYESSKRSRSCIERISPIIPDGSGTGFTIGLRPGTSLWDSCDTALSSVTSYRAQFTPFVHPLSITDTRPM